MKKVIYALMSFGPVLAMAQNSPEDTTEGIGSLVSGIGDVIGKVIPVLFALAIVFFFWGLIQFIRGAHDPKAREEGKSIMIYGVIAIFVMVSIYGLVGWLQNTLGVNPSETPDLPCPPGIDCSI
jgi:hypothetical protein